MKRAFRSLAIACAALLAPGFQDPNHIGRSRSSGCNRMGKIPRPRAIIAAPGDFAYPTPTGFRSQDALLDHFAFGS